MSSPLWRVFDARGNVVASGRRGERSFSYYRGADQGRILGDWNTSRSGADATLLPERGELIRRSWERDANDPMIKGSVLKLLENIIGTGIRVESELDYEALGISEGEAQDLEKAIEREFEIAMKEADYSGNEAQRAHFYDLQARQEKNHTITGECVTVIRYERRPGYTYSLCQQLLDSNRIVTPPLPRLLAQGYEGRTPVFSQGIVALKNGNEIRDGVEVGKRGQVEAIWITNRPLNDAWVALGATEYTRIPAVNRFGEANFWMDFIWHRPEGVRGEPGLASILSGSRQLGEYVNHELTRAEMAAMFGLILKRNWPVYEDDEGLEQSEKVGSAPELDYPQIELFPGMINRLGINEDVTVVNPALPGPNFDMVTERIATIMGSPIGMVRELMLNTFDKSNFSNTRAALQTCKRGWAIKQAQRGRCRVIPYWQRFMDEAVRLGRLVLRGYREDPERRMLWQGCRLYPMGHPYMEPEKDAKAVELRLSTGTTTLKDECAAGEGKNWRDVLKQRAKEQAVFEELGLAVPEWLGGKKETVGSTDGANGLEQNSGEQNNGTS